MSTDSGIGEAPLRVWVLQRIRGRLVLNCYIAASKEPRTTVKLDKTLTQKNVPKTFQNIPICELLKFLPTLIPDFSRFFQLSPHFESALQ